jgi:hypothetical protein
MGHFIGRLLDCILWGGTFSSLRRIYFSFCRWLQSLASRSRSRAAGTSSSVTHAWSSPIDGQWALWRHLSSGLVHSACLFLRRGACHTHSVVARYVVKWGVISAVAERSLAVDTAASHRHPNCVSRAKSAGVSRLLWLSRDSCCKMKAASVTRRQTRACLPPSLQWLNAHAAARLRPASPAAMSSRRWPTA